MYYSFMGGEVSKSGDKEERLSESPGREVVDAA